MSNHQNKKELVNEWVLRAKDDELNIIAILKDRDGTPAHICFTCQQMSEKYLKALLLFYSGDSPKIHALGTLIGLIKPFNELIEKQLKECAILLDPYYIEVRYPADIPIESFTWEMAEESYKAATIIKEFINNYIHFQQIRQRRGR